MGCQTIMLIVYSVLTPSVCLHVYSHKLQANSRFPSSRPLSSFSSSSRSHSLPLFFLARNYIEREEDCPACFLTGLLSEKETKTTFLKTRHGNLRGGSYLSG